MGGERKGKENSHWALYFSPLPPPPLFPLVSPLEKLLKPPFHFIFCILFNRNDFPHHQQKNKNTKIILKLLFIFLQKEKKT